MNLMLSNVMTYEGLDLQLFASIFFNCFIMIIVTIPLKPDSSVKGWDGGNLLNPIKNIILQHHIYEN